MNDFTSLWTDIRDEALAAVDRVGRSGWYVLGGEVRGFEAELAAAWGLPHVVACASGLDALEIGLRVLGLRSGEKVLSTPLTAFATTLAIVRAGGIPVFCDVTDDGQLDFEAVQAALDAHPDIRFFVPVHLYGHPIDALELENVARRGIRIVEDCAQAVGASSRGRPVGSSGDVAATSFYPTKNLGAMGDGGALLTLSEDFAERARQLRDYGQVSKYDHRHLGLNSRLDEVHAAVLRDSLLPRLTQFVRRRRQIAETYIDGIDNGCLRVMGPPDHGSSAWHLFPVVVDGAAEQFRAFLAERGVQTGRHYPSVCPDQHAMDEAPHVLHGSLTQARRIAAGEVSLPVHPYLTDAQAQTVVDACNEWSP